MEAVKVLYTVQPEFKAFQAALKGSNPVSPPNAEPMDLVAAGFEI